MALATAEIIWISGLIEELGVKIMRLVQLFCDNMAALQIAANPVYHERKKHIEIDRHFIKKKLEEGLVCMSYVPSECQLTDVLTKGLNSSRFHDLVFKLGMEDIYSSD